MCCILAGDAPLATQVPTFSAPAPPAAKFAPAPAPAPAAPAPAPPSYTYQQRVAAPTVHVKPPAPPTLRGADDRDEVDRYLESLSTTISQTANNKYASKISSSPYNSSQFSWHTEICGQQRGTIGDRIRWSGCPRARTSAPAAPFHYPSYPCRRVEQTACRSGTWRWSMAFLFRCYDSLSFICCRTMRPLSPSAALPRCILPRHHRLFLPESVLNVVFLCHC